MKRQIIISILLLAVSMPIFAQETNLQLGPAPKELPQINSSLTELTWQRIVKANYVIFADQDTYRETGSFTTKHLVVAMLGCVWDCYYRDDLADFYKFRDLIKNQTSYNKIIKTFFKSPSQQQALYNWVKPFYLDAFKKLPDWKKKIYKQMLNHAENYLSEFDYKAELTLFNQNPLQWETIGPKGKRNFDFRRVEWFIFRRVHNEELSVQQMLEWVKILQSDVALIK